MAESIQARPSLIGLYIRNYIANFSGNIIIVILNFITPLSVYEDWQDTLSKGHWVVIPMIGITMGEIFYLKDLAADCADDGIYEFFFCGPPLPITR